MLPEKNEDFIVADTQDLHEEMIESLIAICEDGISYEDAFVLSDEDIYVYADILSIHDNVVQIYHFYPSSLFFFIYEFFSTQLFKQAMIALW